MGLEKYPGEMEIYFVLWKYTLCYRNQDEFLKCGPLC